MTALNARSLVGRAVVSVADGEKVGTVSDFQFDLEERVVLGLLIGRDGGLFNWQALSLIPFGQVHSFGREAITIQESGGIAVVSGAPREGAATLRAVKKRVITASGEVIGDGDDIIFDDTSGAVSALQLAPQGGFLGIGATTYILPVDEVIEFGRDVITAHDSARARVAGTGNP